MQKTCMITGHHDIPADKLEYVKERLRREIEQAVADGYTDFLFGFAEGADMLFASIVTELKQSNPALRLVAAVPYPGRLKQLERDPEAARNTP